MAYAHWRSVNLILQGGTQKPLLIASTWVEKAQSIRMSLKHRLVLSLAILAFFVMVVAQGVTANTDGVDQSNLTQAVPPNPTTYTEVLKDLARTIDSALQGLATNDGLKATGVALRQWIFAVVLAWVLLKSMMEGGGLTSVVAEVMPLVATFAMVLILVDKGAAKDILDFTQSLGSGLGAGQESPTQNLAATLNSIFMKWSRAIQTIVSMPSPLTTAQNFATLGVYTVVFLLGKVAAAIVVTIGVGIGVANIVLAKFSLALALGFAPVMIPFVLAPATSFLFDAWLRFSLGAALIGVVVNLMNNTGMAMLNSLSTMSEQIALRGTDDLGSVSAVILVFCAGLVMISILYAYLMMQAPQLATGLISGGAGGAGFRGLKALTSGTGFNIAKSATSFAGKTAVASTAGAVMGGVAGVRSANASAQQSGTQASFRQQATAAFKGSVSGAAKANFSGSYQKAQAMSANVGGKTGEKINKNLTPPAASPPRND